MISINIIAPDFHFLEKKGFFSISSDYEKNSFGNVVLILKGPVLLFKVTRDRGQLFFDLGVNFNEWYRLECVIEYIDSSVTQRQLGEPPSSKKLAIHFERLIDDISNLFMDNQRLFALRRLEKEKSNLLINRLFNGKTNV
jgi:hypothetical protein